MTTDALLLLWLAVFIWAAAVRFAARPFSTASWALATLLVRRHPTVWIRLRLALAGRRPCNYR